MALPPNHEAFQVQKPPYFHGSRLVYQLRHNLLQTFEYIAQGVPQQSQNNNGGPEKASSHEHKDQHQQQQQQTDTEHSQEKIFSRELKQRLHATMISLDQLEKLVNNIQQVKGQLTTGNMTLLMQTHVSEQNPAYEDALSAYNWVKKVQDYTNFTLRCINPMNRANQSYYRKITDMSALSTEMPPMTITVATTKLLPFLAKSFPGIEATVIPRGKTTFIILVTLNVMSNANPTGETCKGPVMKLAVLLRQWYLEWVNVKGVDEDFYDDYGKLDYTVSSRHRLFRKLSSFLKGSLLNLNAQLQFGSSPQVPQTILKQFFGLVFSYRTLGAEPCPICKQYLKDYLPAFCRDYRQLSHVMHESCRT